MKYFLLFLLFFTPTTALALDKAEVEKLMRLLEKKDFSSVETFLDKNRVPLSKDPEYYVILLNYVLTKGQGLEIERAKEAKTGEISLTDKSGKVAGRIGLRYDEKLLLDGIRRTQQGLKSFPNRLDIHFGVISVAEEIPRWDIVADQAVQMLKLSKENHNAWTWGPIGEMSGDPQKFLIENLLPRTAKMFESNNAEADAAFVRVSNALLEDYPELVYGYNNLGLMEAANKHFPEALKYFEKAHAIDPKDEIVNANLGKLRSEQPQK